MRRTTIQASILTVLVIAASALGQVHSPKPGDPERKAILDTLRVPVEKELAQEVLFKVNHIAVTNGWAFVFGTVQRPNGGKIDYRHTQYAEAIKAGAFSGDISGLLQYRNGKWKVVTYNIGATDVVWEPWAEQYGAPPAIFKFADR